MTNDQYQQQIVPLAYSPGNLKTILAAVDGLKELLAWAVAYIIILGQPLRIISDQVYGHKWTLASIQAQTDGSSGSATGRGQFLTVSDNNYSDLAPYFAAIDDHQ